MTDEESYICQRCGRGRMRLKCRVRENKPGHRTESREYNCGNSGARPEVFFSFLHRYAGYYPERFEYAQ